MSIYNGVFIRIMKEEERPCFLIIRKGARGRNSHFVEMRGLRGEALSVSKCLFLFGIVIVILIVDCLSDTH